MSPPKVGAKSAAKGWPARLRSHQRIAMKGAFFGPADEFAGFLASEQTSERWPG